MEVGQESDLSQNLIAQKVSFIDEQYRMQVARAVHREDVGLDVAEHDCATAG